MSPILFLFVMQAFMDTLKIDAPHTFSASSPNTKMETSNLLTDGELINQTHQKVTPSTQQILLCG
jgi:hypothetical protein